MTKRIYLTMLAVLLAFSGLYAQNPEVKIGNVTSGPGQILVPLEMLNFTQNVNSITFKITANSNLLTFDGLANVTGFNSVLANQSGNTLHISYADITGYQPNGKVFDLKFNYTAAANANLNFQVELCQVTTGIVNIGNITYTNGVITTTQPIPDPVVKIADVITAPGAVDVGVEMLNFTQNVNSILFKINVPANLLQFIELANINPLMTGTPELNLTGNLLTIGWNSVTGFLPDGHVFDLRLNYVGGFNTDITWSTGNEVSYSGTAVNNISYIKGSVNQLPAVGSVTVGSTGSVTNSSVSLPVMFSGAGFTNVSAFTLFINYDASKLIYQGTSNLFDPAMQINQVGNQINISWQGAALDFSNLTALNLDFIYTGIAPAEVNFLPGCEVNNINATPLATNYVNGVVSPEESTASIKISDVLALPGQLVDVPLIATDLGLVGALDIVVNYDNTKLTLVEIDLTQLSGWEVNQTPGQIIFGWNATGGVVVTNGELLNLEFLYLGGGLTPVTFGGNSAVTAVNTLPMNVNFLNGSIGLGESNSQAIIGSIENCEGNTAIVPVTFVEVGNVTSFTFPIGFSAENLTFVELQNVNPLILSGLIINSGEDFVNISWNNTVPQNLDGKLFDLVFHHLGLNSAVVFNAGAEVSGAGAVILPVAFVNGLVNCNLEYRTLTLNVVGSGIVEVRNGAEVLSPDVNTTNEFTVFYGTELTLTATGNEGWEFSSWTGSVANTSTDVTTVTMINNFAVTANFTMIDYTLTLLVNPVEGGTVTGAGIYNFGNQVEVNAIPNEGWAFVNWTALDGTVVSTLPGNTITMPSSDLTLTANFEMIDYTLTLVANPEAGGTVTGAGVYNFGDAVSVDAIPAEGWAFVNWTNAAGDTVSVLPANVITMPSSDLTLTANFEMTDYTLTLVANPEAGGTVTGAGVYNFGDAVSVDAIPAEGWAFVNWTNAAGDTVSVLPANVITMPSSDLTLTANFEMIDYTLTVLTNPTEGGMVSGAGIYNFEDEVTVAAEPAEGWAFVNWTDAEGEVATTVTYTFSMPSSDLTLTANFEMIDYTLTVIANPTEGGMVSGAGIYNFEDEVTVAAVPSEGWAFVNWTDAEGEVATTVTYTFSMPSSDLTLTANFVMIDYTLTLVANPEIGGTVTGGGVYNFGAVVTVNAIPAAGYEFVNWTNLAGDVVSELPANDITITGDLTLIANFNLAFVASFPFFEDFEEESFPPLGWGIYDVDGNTTVRTWVVTTAQNHTPGGTKSVFHNYGPSTQTEDGWLVTPKIPLPSGIEIKLSFWSYNLYPSDYGKNSVLISTTGNVGGSGDFVEIWTTPSVTQPWMETVVDLTAYAGQEIYLAFRYQGSFAHAWYVDDVLVDEPVYAPLIAVAPASLTETLEVGETSVQQVTVTNNGTADLDFELLVNTSVRAPKVDSKEDYERLLERIALSSENGDVESPAYIETKILPSPTDAITCPAGSLISQPAVNFATAYNSDEGGGYASYQSFTGGGMISGLRFWTISAFFDGTAWGSCTGIDPRPFNIGFYADNAGQPGAQIALYTNIQLTRTATGDMFAGTYPIYEYTATFPDVFVAQGWFSIQSMIGTAVNCWNLTLNQPGGAGVCMQLNTTTNAWTTQTAPLGFCLIEGSSGAANDVGVQAVVSPVSAPNLGNEVVTITVRNYGTASQSNIPVSYTLDGGAAVTGVIAGPLAGGASVNYTFAGTVDMSTVGQTYVINACTGLTGDELAANDCLSASVTNVAPAYCDASTTTEDEYIANVLFGTINNSSVWQGGVANYTDQFTEIEAGSSEAITVTNGEPYSLDKVTVWVDWNMDYTFGVATSEEFVLTNVGGAGASFTGSIMVPEGTPSGDYRMRVRMTYSTDPAPCGNATYGEVEDYTVRVTGDTPPPTEWLSAAPLMGTVAPGETVTIDVAFSAEDLAVGTYQGSLVFSSNDGTNPTVTVPVTLEVTGPTDPIIVVEPASLEETLEQEQMSTQIVTVSNTGGVALTYDLAVNSTATNATQVNFDLPSGGDRANPVESDIIASAVILSQNNGLMRSSFSEGFDDITTLPGAGWALINNSAPVGTTSWFQASATAPFPAYSGDPTSYIGANFNNTAGTGTISNWMLTPETALANGNTISFWTRVPAASSWPDRLEVRLSTNGASQNVGTTATSVGDFTTVLLSVNPDLTVGGYPEVWTQFTATISGLAAPTTGRIAFRYFVTGGGPSGNNSNYIGIDSFEYTGGTVTPDEWLTATPLTGEIAPGESAEIEVTFNAAGLAVGSYTGSLVFTSNDPVTPVVTVPVTLQVEPSSICYPEPRNLTSTVNGQDVTLSWQEPDLGGGGGGGTTEDFFEGFEAGTLPTGWVTYDVDGDNYNWDNTAVEFSVFEAHTGLYCMTSASYRNDVGALTPNNWLVTPSIAVTATSELKFWVSAQDAAWSQEQYYVKVSTTGNAVADFTNTVHSAISPAAWAEVVVDLSSFAGQTIYIAFQHANVTDMFFIKLDDVTVTNTSTKAAYTAPVAAVQSNEIFFRTSGMTQGEIDSKLNPTYTFGSGEASEYTTAGGEALLIPEGIKHMSGSRSRTLLFDNGPFINSPGTGPNGSDESVLQNSTLGMTTLGPSINYATAALPIRVADDFEVTETWTIDAFTFYAYQTSAAHPTPPVSTITSGRLQIWNGVPGAAGSEVVWGNMETNAMASTSWTNSYRVSQTTINAQRPIMQVVCATPELVLEPGNYWVEWSMTGSIASGPWGVPVTINGELNTGNAMQITSTTNAWTPLLDGGSLTPYGLSFLVEGTAGGGGPEYNLTGYNIYRDGTLIATNPTTQRSYLDSPLTPGTYTYGVTAVYDQPSVGESDPIEATVTISNVVDINMQNGTITICEGNFYDSGGATGQYQNDENLTLTFLPATAGAKMKFNFVEYNTEANYDYLKVFDGPNTSSPQIGPAEGFNGVGVPALLAELVASNAQGAITFQFTSDGSVPRDGWKALISCFTPADIDLEAKSVSGNITPSVGTATTYNVEVKNLGSTTQSTYTVKLMQAGGVELNSVAGPTIEAGQTLMVPLSWTPTAQGPTSIYGVVEVTGDGNPQNNTSPSLNVTVQPEGVVAITVGVGNVLPTFRIPFDFYWKNSLSQTIYYPEELENIGGALLGVNYYNSFTTNLPGKAVKIWVGTTEMADLSQGWADPSGFTLVYDGTVDFPSGSNAIYIPFSEPYIYGGGNLVIYTNRVWEDVYFLSSDLFYATETASKPNRTRHVQLDATVFDPLNPPAPADVQLKSWHPNTTLFFNTSGLGALQGVVSSSGQPVEGVKVQVEGTSVMTHTNAQGQYNFPYLLPGNINVTASKFGYVAQTLPTTIVVDQTATLNFSLQAMPTVTVSGFVAGSDAPTVGIAGAQVSLEGYENYEATTNAAGMFSIPGVYASNTYTVEVSASGYANYSGTAVVGTTNLVLPNIILQEVMAPPANLTANISATNPNLVNLAWNMQQDVEFRYDDGVRLAQLGSTSGTLNTVLGSKHTTSAVLNEMSWLLSDAPDGGGPHNSIKIYVFGLTGAGLPDGNNVLYSATVSNTDGVWNTHTFPTPVTASGGFFLGVAYAGFVGLGTDDGVGDPYVFQTGTHYFVGDYTAGGWETWETYNFLVNGMIRGLGVPGGKASYALNETPAPQVTTANSGTLELIKLAQPVASGEPSWTTQGDQSRSLLGFNVYKNGEVMAAMVQEMTYSYTEMQMGVHCYHVTAMYGSGESAPSNQDCVDILVGVNELADANTSIYPNPAKNSLNIESLPMSRITVINALGQTVLDMELNRQNKLVLNVEGWDAGVYMLRIVTSEGTVTKRATIVK